MPRGDDEKRGVSCSAKSAGGYDVRRGVWCGVRRDERRGERCSERRGERCGERRGARCGARCSNKFAVNKA